MCESLELEAKCYYSEHARTIMGQQAICLLNVGLIIGNVTIDFKESTDEGIIDSPEA